MTHQPFPASHDTYQEDIEKDFPRFCSAASLRFDIFTPQIRRNVHIRVRFKLGDFSCLIFQRSLNLFFVM